jgi:hypothetical protein
MSVIGMDRPSMGILDTSTLQYPPEKSEREVFSKQLQQIYDASTYFGPNRYIWQAHSADDDRVHSATLRDTNTFEMLGCVVLLVPQDRRLR